jgi:hypothetical protein
VLKAGFVAWIGFIKQQRDMTYIGRKGKYTQKFGVGTGRGLFETHMRRCEYNIKTDSIWRLNQQINIDI